MRNSDIKTIYVGTLLSLLFLLGSACPGPAHSQELQWLPFEKALVAADTSGRPVLVEVWAPWCGWCRKMKKEVYPALVPELSGPFILTRINRDNTEAVHHYRGQKLAPLRLSQKFRAQQVPTLVFLNPRGDYLLHITGYLSEKELRPVLEYISAEVYKGQSFEAFRKETGF